jgi:hypothetical protein
MAKELNKKEDTKAEGLEFLNSDLVLVKGTEDKKFSMSPKKEYKVSGVMAKILIDKKAAEFIKVIKK